MFSIPILFPLPTFLLHLGVEDEEALANVGNNGTADTDDLDVDEVDSEDGDCHVLDG